MKFMKIFCPSLILTLATPLGDTLDIETQGEFEWTELQEGYVLGSVYVGHMIMSVFSGGLSDLYGAKRVIGISFLLEVIVIILTPTITRANFPLLIATRILQGCITAPVLPAISSLMSKWFPVKEQTR